MKAKFFLFALSEVITKRLDLLASKIYVSQILLSYRFYFECTNQLFYDIINLILTIGGVMKIFITGNSGCGKSTMARKLAEKHNLSLCPLDDIVWDKDKKRPHEVRTEILNEFLKNENWVIEGMSHSPWMHEVYVKADYIFLLQISDRVAKWRIRKRHIKKKLGLEKGHKEGKGYVKNLYKIREDYKREIIPEIEERLKGFSDKSFVVKNIKEVNKIIKKQ